MLHVRFILIVGIPKYNCKVNENKTLTNFILPGYNVDVMSPSVGKYYREVYFIKHAI